MKSGIIKGLNRRNKRKSNMRWYMINYHVDWINLEVRCIEENGYKTGKVG